MPLDLVTFGSLLWGTVRLRPYVVAFFLAFALAAWRDLGPRRTFGFFAWCFSVAVAAEYLSTRFGFPFGLYHYTETTKGAELYLANVPVFDSLSFVFLSYAALCLCRRALGDESLLRVVVVSGLLMVLLDVVVDPLAVRGDRWFLGRVFYYPTGGVYFGVPLSNFAGWALVGWIIVGGYAWASRRMGGAPWSDHRRSGPGAALYDAVLCFNLVMTLWIGDLPLLASGMLVHAAGRLLLYEAGASVRSRRLEEHGAGVGEVFPARARYLVGRRSWRS